ncbi:unnamed protein product, partial [Ilex paraguariensis]
MARTNSAAAVHVANAPRNNGMVGNAPASVVVRSSALGAGGAVLGQNNLNNGGSISVNQDPQMMAANAAKVNVTNGPKQLPPQTVNGAKHNHLDNNSCDITKMSGIKEKEEDITLVQRDP